MLNLTFGPILYEAASRRPTLEDIKTELKRSPASSLVLMLGDTPSRYLIFLQYTSEHRIAGGQAFFGTVFFHGQFKLLNDAGAG